MKPTPYPNYESVPDVFQVDPAVALEALRTRPFATSNKLGLPLNVPSTQTILPIVCGGLIDTRVDSPTFGKWIQGSHGVARLLGWIPIVSTVFAGTETSFTTSDGPIPVTSLTLPLLNQNVSGASERVQQYMVGIFDENQERLSPWLGYSDFIDASQSQYMMQWYMPTQGQGHRLNMGPLITDLIVRMDADAGTPPTPPLPPTVVPATLRWVCSLAMNDLQTGCGFIDFNWVNLFMAQTTDVDPLKIEIVSNPPTGEFKTTIVPFPVTAPLGGVEFNTLRIIRLHEALAGDYVFNYAVVDRRGQSTPVTLTITVV